jgi:branched-chain amino acid transport system substrate-binding protein
MHNKRGTLRSSATNGGRGDLAREGRACRRPATCLFLLLVALLGLGGLLSCGSPQEPQTIKIGVIAPLTGSIPLVGQSTVNAAQLAVNEVNDAGGLSIDGQQLQIELLIEDNEDKKETAVSAAQKLINQAGVVAIVGPQASRNAIPAAAVAESARVPLISPWSTNPETTAGRKYVFRVAFIDPFQGRVMARFAIEELGAQKAAVLYDVASEYNKGIAEIFRQIFVDAGGEMAAFESYTTGETDFSAQLAAIKDSGADVLFLPNYYSEIPLQVGQAREMGLDLPIIGADAWGPLEADALPDLEGCFFSTHYATDIASPVAQAFVSSYEAAYGQVPDDVAALTYDAFGLLSEAIRSQGKADSESIRNGLASIRRYEGVTGVMEFQATGDPVKSAVILKIEGGKFVFYRQAEP